MTEEVASGVENLDNIDVQIVDLRQKDARSKESDIARIVHLDIHNHNDGIASKEHHPAVVRTIQIPQLPETAGPPCGPAVFPHPLQNRVPRVRFLLPLP